MIFWSIQYRLENEDNAIEEDNTIEQVEKIEIKTNNYSGYIHNVNCDSPVWKKEIDVSNKILNCFYPFN